MLKIQRRTEATTSKENTTSHHRENQREKTQCFTIEKSHFITQYDKIVIITQSDSPKNIIICDKKVLIILFSSFQIG